MKAAAIFIPLALFLLPTFATVAISISSNMRGKGDEISRPISRRKSKNLITLIYVHMFVIFPASVGWSAYVFTGLIWLSVLYFFIFALPVPILIMVFKSLGGMPKPPPGGWPDAKTKLEAFARWRDERQKRTDAEQEQRYKETESIVLGIFSKRGLGIILILFGLFMIVGAVGDMCSPPSDLPLRANISILIFVGILPLAGGIALCVRDRKKWRKPKAKQQEQQNPPPSQSHVP
jgi:flagellar basal body-associated protein FliL